MAERDQIKEGEIPLTYWGEWRTHNDTDLKIVQQTADKEIRGFRVDQLALYYENIGGEPDPTALAHSQLMLSIVDFYVKTTPKMRDLAIVEYVSPRGDVYISFAIPQGREEDLKTSRSILIDAANEIINPLTYGQNLIPLPPEDISSA